MTEEQRAFLPLLNAGEVTQEDLSKFISTAIAEGIKQAGLAGCPLNQDGRKEAGHFFGMIEDLGNGDVRRGVEIMRENSKLVALLTSARNKIGNTVLAVLVAAVTGGIIKLIWEAATGKG